MKNFYWIVLLFLAQTLNAQSVFDPEHTVYTRNKDEWYIDAVSLNSKEMLLMGQNLDASLQKQELVLQKTNLAGEVLTENKLLLSADTVYRFCNLFYRNGRVEAIGYAGKLRSQINTQQFHSVFFRYVFDTALNLLYKQEQPIPIGIDFSVMYMRCKINLDGNLYGAMQLFMAPAQVPLSPFGNFYFILDSSNQFQTFRLDSDQYDIKDAYGFELEQLSKSRYIGLIGAVYDALFEFSTFHLFDEKLVTPNNKDVQNSVFEAPYYHFAAPFSNILSLPTDTNHFILAATGALFSSYKNVFSVSKVKYDSTVKYLKDSNYVRSAKTCFFKYGGFSGSTGVSYLPAYYQCLDRDKTGDYLFAGMLNHRMDERTIKNDLVADTLCFAYIDPDLNLKLLKTYFNNQQITLHKVMFMPDGSALAIGFTRNYIQDTSNLSRDYFAIKLNSKGEVVSGLDQTHFAKYEWIVYPNPCMGKIQIQTGRPVSKVALINLLGQTIYTSTFTLPTQNIDVNEIPAGYYILLVQWPDGSYSQKKILSVTE